MKKAILYILLVLPFILNAQESGECKKDKLFLAVQVYDGVLATFERGEEYQVCAGSDTDLKELQISIIDSILRIRKTPGTKYEKQPKILIKYVTINSIEGYAKADLDTRNLIITDSLTIVLKSGSRFYAGCDVKYLNASVAEGSLLKIDGYALEQLIYTSGKATFSGFELDGETADVKASTGGTIKLNVDTKITGSSSTRGYVTYKNSPKIDVKASSGGKLVKND